MQYNRGCVLLAEGNPSAAIAQWGAIPIHPDSFPLLTRRIHTNLAVARLQQAESALQHLSQSDFERGRFQLEEALIDVRAAMKEECALQKIEGAQSCVPARDLEVLDAKIKNLFAKGAVQWLQFEQEEATPSQRLFLLLGSLSLLQQRFTFLSNQSQPVASYLDLFASEGKSWVPLWESSQKAIDTLKDAAVSASFSKARQEYEDSLVDLEHAAYSSGKEKLEQAFNLLTSLANQLGLNEPIATAIRQLLGSYQLALIEEPLQEWTLEQLMDEQKRLIEPLQLNPDEKSSIDLATGDLALSLKALEKGRSLTGRFYFEEARYQLTKILRPAKRGNKPTPLEVLVDASDAQHQAIVLNRLVERMEGGEKQEPEIRERTLKSQKAAVAAAAPFLEAVYIQQLHDFQQPGSLEERCQAHPWDQALPLFEKGYRQAMQAATEEPRPALLLQEQALQSWIQVIHLLQQPKAAFKGTCEGGGGQPQAGGGEPQQKPQKESPQEQKIQVPMNQVLRNIQEMDEEDRKPQTTPSVPLKGGERPW